MQSKFFNFLNDAQQHKHSVLMMTLLYPSSLQLIVVFKKIKLENFQIKMISLTSTGPNLSPKDLIQSLFSSPIIGATCSQAAEEICQKNNLNFVSLVQPFSKISTEGNVHLNTDACAL